jgi:hypothetical protein
VTIYTAVSIALERRGQRASAEYPGYVCVPVGPVDAHFGTANGDWGGDLVDDEGRAFAVVPMPLVVPPTCEDAEVIAGAILAAIHGLQGPS